MALTFTRLADAVDIDYIPVEQNWQATDDLTGHFISKSYPIADTQAAIEADLTVLFPANPVVSEDALSPIRGRVQGNTFSIVDGDGKVIAVITRDAAGNAELQAVDANGNRRRVLTPQQGTLKLDAAATIADVTFPEPFTEHPVVQLTPSKPLPNFDLKPTKTGFELSFASPPAATVSWEAKPPRRS